MSDWARVSRRVACPICSHASWCGIAPDGLAAICMRVPSGHMAKNGGWLHRLTSPIDIGTVAPRASWTVAPIHRLNPIYSALLALWPLRDDDREHLRTVRGLSDEAIDGAGFASVPSLALDDQAARLDLGRIIARRFGLLAGVPGFYRDDRAWAIVPTERGIGIPIRDRPGRVQGITIRATSPTDPDARYRPLSSGNWRSGASCGAPVAVWHPERARAGVLITEGALKALVAAERRDCTALGLAGVTNWHGALPLVEHAPADLPIIVAVDTDSARNIHVWKAKEDLCRALAERGHRVLVATWPTSAKGIDDALLAGLDVDIRAWTPSLPPAVRPFATVSTVIPTRPQASLLGGLR